jgi:hypothetical protein
MFVIFFFLLSQKAQVLYFNSYSADIGKQNLTVCRSLSRNLDKNAFTAAKPSIKHRLPMKKKMLLTAVFISVLVLPAVTGTDSIFFASADDVADIVASSYHAVLIENPANHTIYANEIPLNLTVDYLYQDGLIAWQNLNTLSYSVDDRPPVVLKTIQGPSSIPYKFSTVLNVSELSNGQHKMKVTASFAANINNLFVPTYDFSSEPVYFTVYNTPPPAVSIISLENKTYKEMGLSLIFAVDKSTSWMAYSLDNQANVTILGNVTLSELSYGSHRITVYSNDSLGNMGASGTIYFSISEPFPTLFVVASVITVAVIGAGLLFYFKKRRR